MPLTSTPAPLRPLATVCALTLGALLTLLALAGPAAAHAELVSSSPTNGAVLAAEPPQVTLVFSEEVTPRLSSVKVIGPDGHQVDGGALRAVGSDGLAVDLAADPQQGTFVLNWLATAADDGHATSGTLTFSVGAPSRTAAAGRLGAPNRVTDAVLDLAVWLGVAGLALLVGCTAVRRYCLPAAAGPSWAADLRRHAVFGWTAVLAGALVQLFVQGSATQGDSLAHTADRALLAATLSTHAGHALVARIVLLALVAAVGEPLLRRAAGGVAAVLLTLALAATWAETSHASSGSLAPLALAVTTLHVSAMAVWGGGLVALVVLRADGTVAARFSRLALGAVPLLAATGLYQAFREVGSLGALTGTSYGRLLLVKTAGFLLVLAVAAAARTGVARLRRAVLLELVGVSALLVVTVLLIGTAPARG